MNDFLDKKMFWLCGFFVVSLSILWVLSEVLRPFILSMILAYCLNPIVNKIERLGIARFIAVMAVMFISASFVMLCLAWVLPRIISQIQSLILIFPDLTAALFSKINGYFPEVLNEDTISNQGVLFLKSQMGQKGVSVAKELFSYSLAVFDILVLFVVVPIVTFYLLVDWNKLLKGISSLVPKNSKVQVFGAVAEIDQVLSSFLRGQLMICTLLALFYTLGLLLVELEYAIVIGCFAGFISFIPFVGAILGAVFALWVATFQFWNEPLFIGSVLFLFLLGQFLESNFLTPKLVGEAISLHPIWIIFALSVGGALAGLSGVMLAVPVAAVIGVLVRQTISDLKKAD